MRILTAVIAALSLISVSPANADETAKEKVQHAGKTVKNKAKKAGNRVEEAVCMEGDAKCAAEKAKNRVGEGASGVGTKVEEVKEKVD